MHHSIHVQLVRLEDGDYSVPVGTFGVIDSTAADTMHHFVSWAASGVAGPHGSGPIADIDLERLGTLTVRLPDETEERLKLADLKDPARIAREALRKALENLSPEMTE